MRSTGRRRRQGNPTPQKDNNLIEDLMERKLKPSSELQQDDKYHQ
jgi:hypothetical protein